MSLTVILGVVKALLSFADGLTAYLNQGQLLEAGKAIERASNLQRAINEVSRANDARERVARDLAAHGPDWVPDDDGFRRD